MSADTTDRLLLSGWCNTPHGKPDQYHDGCRWELCQCPNHERRPSDAANPNDQA